VGNQTNGTAGGGGGTPSPGTPSGTTPETAAGQEPSSSSLVVPPARELVVSPVLMNAAGKPINVEEYEGLKLVGMSIADLEFDPVKDKGEPFENECLETCLIERAPSNDTNYTVNINITNGTYLKLNDVIYLEYKPLP